MKQVMIAMCGVLFGGLAGYLVQHEDPNQYYVADGPDYHKITEQQFLDAGFDKSCSQVEVKPYRNYIVFICEL